MQCTQQKDLVVVPNALSDTDREDLGQHAT
jgi:hypothetical protein